MRGESSLAKPTRAELAATAAFIHCFFSHANERAFRKLVRIFYSVRSRKHALIFANRRRVKYPQDCVDQSSGFFLSD